MDTLEVLEELDFKYILGDNIHIKSNKIPIVSSSIYGRIKDISLDNCFSDVITLHITWEYDELYRKFLIKIYGKNNLKN